MKRGFTLIEMMAAVLLGSMVILMVAGGLHSAIRSWETVQERVSVNYNRRSVLDLIKRQASSLFFRSDADELDQAANGGGPRTQTSGFVIPDGSSFFAGNVQELNFLSTVSFLTDFPGQVAVRYYVVQGDPGDDENLADLPTSRSGSQGEGAASPGEDLDFSFDEGAVTEALEGQLYLYIEEKNLFLASTMPDLEDHGFESVDLEGAGGKGDGDKPKEGDGDSGASADESQVLATNSMKLIGPLRQFTIRYRNPGVTRSTEADEDEDWSESWSIDRQGGYPTAIELNLIFEPEGDPEKTAEIPTEELDGVRLVLPIYDAENLVRGGLTVSGRPPGSSNGRFPPIMDEE